MLACSIFSRQKVPDGTIRGSNAEVLQVASRVAICEASNLLSVEAGRQLLFLQDHLHPRYLLMSSRLL